jgi:hypothetical protein
MTSLWTYHQSTGHLTYGGDLHQAIGYSGHASGLNNPAAQSIHAVGPIPQGRYSIGEPHDSPHTGPYTLDLTPLPGTNTYGRDDFRIHGDNAKGDHSASHGCVILPLTTRQAIWNSSDHVLEVIA